MFYKPAQQINPNKSIEGGKHKEIVCPSILIEIINCAADVIELLQCSRDYDKETPVAACIVNVSDDFGPLIGSTKGQQGNIYGWDRLSFRGNAITGAFIKHIFGWNRSETTGFYWWFDAKHVGFWWVRELVRTIIG